MFPQRSGTARSSRRSHPQSTSSTNSRNRGAYSSVSPHEPIPLRTGGSRRRDIHGWPPGPRTLHKEGRAYLGLMVRNCLTIAATIPFLVLAAYAWSKNGEAVDNGQWQKIKTATYVVCISPKDQLTYYIPQLTSFLLFVHSSRPSRHFPSYSQR